ncbi:MAG: 2-hydroxyacyl-CoA dehydratase, partial [Clostridium sp.]
MRNSFNNQVSEYIKYISDCGSSDQLKYFIDVAKNYLNNLDENNSKMIGITSVNFPELFIRVCDMTPVYILGGCEGVNNEVDEIFPQVSDSVTKSAISLLFDESMPFIKNLEGIVAYVTNDSNRKMPYYLEKKGYKVLSIESLPFLSHVTKALFRKSQNEFLMSLMKLSHRIITKKKLIKYTRMITKSHNLFKQIDESVLETKVKIFLKESYYLAMDIEQWQKEVEILLNKIKSNKNIFKDDSIDNDNLMIIGCEIQFPNFKISSILEESGIKHYKSRCCVPYPCDYSELDENRSLIGLLNQIHDIHYRNTPKINILGSDKTEFDSNTNAVLFHLLKGQLLSAYYANKVEQICINMDIPFLCVETDYTKADKEQVKIRIEAFTELLKVKNKSDKRRKKNEKPA